MKNRVLAIVPVLLGFLHLEAEARDLQRVSSPGFEGVIFTPERMREDASPCFYTDGEMWTPSREAVLKAERALPAAISVWTSTKPDKPGPNFPNCCPAKNGTNLRFTTIVPDSRPDSVIDDHRFLFDVAPTLSDYKRQYLGAVIDGKKIICLSFIQNYVIDTCHQDWRHHWVAILDGGDLTWSVLYDPATGGFRDWLE